MKKLLTCCLVVLLFACNSDDDNQPPPVNNTKVNINDLAVDEGDSSTKTIFVQVQLSQSATKQVTVKVNAVDGAAKSGEDFTGISETTLVFEIGDQLKEIEMQILGDEEPEANESFNVVVVEADGAGIDKGTGTITIKNDDGGVSGDIFIPGGTTSPESYAGMELIWQDEFNGTEVNESDWTFELGNGNDGWGNWELEYYKKENASIYEDDYLVIEAKEEPFGGFNYTSTRMITKNKFDFQYGRVDIRANLPQGQGIWPALWMLGENISSVGWPRCGEIDIMEIVGHQPSTLYGTAHWYGTDNASYGGNTSLSSGVFNDEFHVFSLVWSPTSLTWLLDDVEYHTMSITGGDLTEFHQNFFFIFNVAVGGTWPGSPDGTTVFPQRMIVDYIRVFQ